MSVSYCTLTPLHSYCSSLFDRAAPEIYTLSLHDALPILLRAVRRFAVLLVADLASFYVMREAVRAVRDYAWFGDSLAGQLEGILPHGIVNGWQYAVALFVALFLTGNYGRGDPRRDPARML